MIDPVILALDLAGRTGWAVGNIYVRVPISASVRFGSPGASLGAVFSDCRSTVAALLSTYLPDIVVFEAPMVPGHMGGRTNVTTIRQLIGLASVVEEICFSRQIYDVREARVVDIRRHFLGSIRHKRVAAKALTIAACRRLGWNPADDNAADALALWHYQASLFEPKLALQTSPLFRRGN
jgi:crossover junction endodeoxyribonuclease RuvC